MTTGIQIDNAELMSLLESSDIQTSAQVKDLIQEQLNAGREAWLVNAVVDSFIESHSVRCLEILAGMNEPNDKHLYDRLYEHWKTGNRIQTLMIVGHLVRREPLWLSRIASHSLLTSVVKVLKSETDSVTLLTGALAIASLLPVIPMAVVPLLLDIFEVFNRLVLHAHNKSGYELFERTQYGLQHQDLASHRQRVTSLYPSVVSDAYLLHLRVGAHIMFHRLYGMYPCHFLTHLRSSYGRPESAKLFKDVVMPMLSRVRIHPLLVTATREKELIRERWKHKGTYDILVECAELSLDAAENVGVSSSDSATCQPSPTLAQAEHVRAHSSHRPAVEIASAVASDPVPCCSEGYPPSEMGGLVTPPPPSYSTGVAATPVSCTSTPPSGHSTVVHSRHSRPPPLMLSPGTGLEETTQPGVEVPSTFGTLEDSSLPSTPLTTDSASFRPHGTSFEFARVAQSCSGEELNLDLSGRFGDGVCPPKLVTVSISTQTSVTDTEVPTVRVRAPVDQATSTEQGKIAYEDSDSSSSSSLPLSSAATQASVAAFVKKVKRIRFNSISVAKDHRQANGGVLASPRVWSNHTLSCPDLTEMATDADAGSSVSSVHHHFMVGSPATSMRVTSPLTVDRLSVGTQTLMYVQGSECDSVTHLAPYESLTALTIPFAPFVQCYACMHQSQSIDEMPRAKTVPLYMSYSPAELLDRHLDESCRQHAAQLHSASATSTSSLNASMTSPSQSSLAPSSASHDASFETLKHELSVLHAELMYERQRREVHTRRGRRLLSRIKHLNSLAEQNEAMRDQLRLQEAELHKMNEALQAEQQTSSALRLSLEQHKSDFDVKTKKYVNAEEDFQSRINELEATVDEQKAAKESVDRELELDQHHSFLKDRDLEMLRQKAECATQLKEQLNQLNTELLLMGELHGKYQQRLSETTNLHSTEMINLRTGYDTAVADNTDLRALLQSKTVELEATRAILADAEQRLLTKDVMIEEQKWLLECTKTDYHKKLEIAEMSHRDFLLRDQRTILDLQNELSFIRQKQFAPKGRHLMSDPVLNNSSARGYAAAAFGGHHSEPSISEIPSPASSAAEALELEAVTIGFDATDLLNDNSNSTNHV